MERTTDGMIAIALVPCPQCGAIIGRPCRDKRYRTLWRGRRAHTPRVNAAYTVRAVEQMREGARKAADNPQEEDCERDCQRGAVVAYTNVIEMLRGGSDSRPRPITTTED